VARIALVCEPPDGGVAEHVALLARGLPAQGHEAVVFAAADYRPRAALLAAGHPVVELPFVRDYAHPHRDARALGRLARALGRFDVVHAHSAKAGVLGRLAAALARRPAVYTPHGLPWIGEMQAARRQFAETVERALAPLTAALICVCEAERGFARTAGLPLGDRLVVVHNRCPACADPAVAGDGLAVGTVSTYRRAKRLDVLLDAAPAILAAVPEATVRLVGEGPEAPALRAHRAARDSRVVFAPFTPPSAHHLRGLDVFVLCSGWESFPMGVLEALACGVPQVVSDVGGTREAVTPDTGVVVPRLDPAALAGAVIELLRDPGRRARMAAASRRRHAEHFGTERMVAATAAVYERVLSTRRGR
jgi:glycosyltransferase involved in cell wall biosynthesis